VLDTVEFVWAPRLSANALPDQLSAVLASTKALYLVVGLPDCRFADGAIERAAATAAANAEVGAWEFCVKPIAAAKPYHPLSFAIAGLSGPAVLINVAAWRSCRARTASWETLSRDLLAGGFSLRYLPHCAVWCEWSPLAPPAKWERLLARVLRKIIVTAGYGGFSHDLEFRATAGFRYPPAPPDRPLVSLIMRTHAGRRTGLVEALRCVRQQTYEAFELVLIEDGSEEAAPLAADDERIVYRSVTKRGRTAAGNAGLALARGRYIGFFDDDDLLWPDHIEVLVGMLALTGRRAAYAYAIESAIGRNSAGEIRHRLVGEDFTRDNMRLYNRVPIQAVLFERSLYEEVGGFDESLEYLEDWDLWLRYLSATEFACAPKITSLYRVPGDRAAQMRRAMDHQRADIVLRAKHALPDRA